MSMNTPGNGRRFSQDAEKLTEDLCTENQLYARIRMRLLRLEQEGERRGWDHPDNLFRVFIASYNPKSNQVETTWNTPLTDGVRSLERYMPHGTAFEQITDRFEKALAGDGLDKLPASIRRLVHDAQSRVGQDRVPGKYPGWKFLGFGVREEAFEDFVDNPYDLSGLHPSESPDREEVRAVLLVTRHGTVWHVVRVRGHEPAAVVIPRDKVNAELVGTTAHGLSRLVNAVVDESTPIIPTEYQKE